MPMAIRRRSESPHKPHGERCEPLNRFMTFRLKTGNGQMTWLWRAGRVGVVRPRPHLPFLTYLFRRTYVRELGPASEHESDCSRSTGGLH